MRPAVSRILFPSVILAAGIACGIGGYTFVYAQGGSYLTNDPAFQATEKITGPK